MPALKLRKFGSHEELDLFLRGGISSGPIAQSAPSDLVVYGLDGKTLIFSTPTVTVTFSAADAQAGLALDAIVDQINAVLTGCVASALRRCIRIVKSTPGTIVLTSPGTANALLGFATDSATTGTKYNAPDGAAPRLISIETFGPSESVLLVATEE